jgi:hypothetical protein
MSTLFWIISSIKHIDDIVMKIYHISCVTFISVHGNSLNLVSSQYSTEGKVKEPNLALEAGQGLLTAASSYARGDMGGVMQSVTGFVRTATTGRSTQARARQMKTSPADVVRTRPILFFRQLKSVSDIMERV